MFITAKIALVIISQSAVVVFRAQIHCCPAQTIKINRCVTDYWKTKSKKTKTKQNKTKQNKKKQTKNKKIDSRGCLKKCYSTGRRIPLTLRSDRRRELWKTTWLNLKTTWRNQSSWTRQKLSSLSFSALTKTKSIFMSPTYQGGLRKKWCKWGLI